MAITQVADISELVDRHNELAVVENQTLIAAITEHPFETWVGSYPTTPDMNSVGVCVDCGEPELTVLDSLSLKPTTMCRHCINTMRRYSLRHKRVNLAVDPAGPICVSCTTSGPRMDKYGLIIGPWYHQMRQVQDSSGLDASGNPRVITGLASDVAAGRVSLDSETNIITIAAA